MVTGIATQGHCMLPTQLLASSSKKVGGVVTHLVSLFVRLSVCLGCNWKHVAISQNA